MYASFRRPLPAAAIWLVVAILLGIVLGLIGPFGSYFNGGALVRIGYWTLAMVLGVALFGGVMSATWRWRRNDRPERTAAILLLAVLAAGVPHAFATRLVALHIWPLLASVGPSPIGWYAQGIVIALPVCAAYAAANGWFAGPARDPDAPMTAEPGEPALIGRIPARLGRDIQCLRMEDHYVRVCTAEGSVLLLMPLAQAIPEMAPCAGLQTHRSWWVARHAVVKIDGSQRAMTLTLANGMEAPVARSAVTRLRAAGWLDL